MRFWDSSALMTSIVEEPMSEVLGKLLREDGEIVVWWGTWVECAVAISRLLREGMLTEEDEEEARASLLSQQHPRKAADALQLAAAFVWRENAAEDKSFVCLDDRLREAASEEGFDVLPNSSREPGEGEAE